MASSSSAHSFLSAATARRQSSLPNHESSGPRPRSVSLGDVPPRLLPKQPQPHADPGDAPPIVAHSARAWDNMNQLT
eukprot:3904774-Prymnesium_polylepis.1